MTITKSADRELLELRQGNKDLVAYLTQFNRLVAETEWPEEKRSAIYHQGLRDELKDIVAQIDPQPQSCDDLIALTLRLDHRLSDRKKGEKKRSDLRFPLQTREKSSNPSKDTSEPMEIGGIRGPLNTEEKELRRKNGQCLYCGKKGHFV